MSAVLPFDIHRVNLSQVQSRTAMGIPPSSVEEYLARVRLEAELIPDIVVMTPPSSTSSPAIFDATNTFDISQIIMASTDDERHLQLNHFRTLREKLRYWSSSAVRMNMDEYPKLKDMEGWRHVMKDLHPTTSFLLSLDHIKINVLFKYHVSWLSSSVITSHGALWIYALLSRMELPLEISLSGNIRTLLWQCVQQREDECEEHTNIHTLELLITILGVYFQQLDLQLVSSSFR